MIIELREELLGLVNEDQKVRNELIEDGTLFEGYHPKMEAVHKNNAKRLLEIIEEKGWPGKSLVGEDGTNAAWLIVQHAISQPDFLRKMVKILEVEVQKGELDGDKYAMLVDRIRFFEGKPQIYGTQFDWDDNGELSPSPIEDPDHVEERRKQMGLPSLEEVIKRHRENVVNMKEQPPQNINEYRKKQQEWAKSVGWID